RGCFETDKIIFLTSNSIWFAFSHITFSLNSRIEADPATFGLNDLPLGNITIFGQGADKLFGITRGTATLDFQNFVGTVSNTISITGGSGTFEGAIGTLILSENLTLNPDPTAPIRGLPLISGSFQTFQTVSEPRNTTAIFSIGLIGVGFLLRRHRTSP
ncbi:MAG: hypothetical protein V7L17_15645, partial [Nostoc sp.]